MTIYDDTHSKVHIKPIYCSQCGNEVKPQYRYDDQRLCFTCFEAMSKKDLERIDKVPEGTYPVEYNHNIVAEIKRKVN